MKAKITMHFGGNKKKVKITVKCWVLVPSPIMFVCVFISVLLLYVHVKVNVFPFMSKDCN